jgi:hypothetical protein
MLWSVVPEDAVFAGFNEGFSLIDGEVENCHCRLRLGGDGSASIESLCSTNPKDYLNRNLQPGRRIFLLK